MMPKHAYNKSHHKRLKQGNDAIGRKRDRRAAKHANRIEKSNPLPKQVSAFTSLAAGFLGPAYFFGNILGRSAAVAENTTAAVAVELVLNAANQFGQYNASQMGNSSYSAPTTPQNSSQLNTLTHNSTVSTNNHPTVSSGILRAETPAAVSTPTAATNTKSKPNKKSQHENSGETAKQKTMSAEKIKKIADKLNKEVTELTKIDRINNISKDTLTNFTSVFKKYIAEGFPIANEEHARLADKLLWLFFNTNDDESIKFLWGLGISPIIISDNNQYFFPILTFSKISHLNSELVKWIMLNAANKKNHLGQHPIDLLIDTFSDANSHAKESWIPNCLKVLDQYVKHGLVNLPESDQKIAIGIMIFFVKNCDHDSHLDTIKDMVNKGVNPWQSPGKLEEGFFSPFEIAKKLNNQKIIDYFLSVEDRFKQKPVDATNTVAATLATSFSLSDFWWGFGPVFLFTVVAAGAAGIYYCTRKPNAAQLPRLPEIKSAAEEVKQEQVPDLKAQQAREREVFIKYFHQRYPNWIISIEHDEKQNVVKINFSQEFYDIVNNNASIHVTIEKMAAAFDIALDNSSSCTAQDNTITISCDNFSALNNYYQKPAEEKNVMTAIAILRYNFSSHFNFSPTIEYNEQQKIVDISFGDQQEFFFDSNGKTIEAKDDKEAETVDRFKITAEELHGYIKNIIKKPKENYVYFSQQKKTSIKSDIFIKLNEENKFADLINPIKANIASQKAALDEKKANAEATKKVDDFKIRFNATFTNWIDEAKFDAASQTVSLKLTKFSKGKYKYRNGNVDVFITPNNIAKFLSRDAIYNNNSLEIKIPRDSFSSLDIETVVSSLLTYIQSQAQQAQEPTSSTSAQTRTSSPKPQQPTLTKKQRLAAEQAAKHLEEEKIAEEKARIEKEAAEQQAKELKEQQTREKILRKHQKWLQTRDALAKQEAEKQDKNRQRKEQQKTASQTATAEEKSETGDRKTYLLNVKIIEKELIGHVEKLGLLVPSLQKEFARTKDFNHLTITQAKLLESCRALLLFCCVQLINKEDLQRELTGAATLKSTELRPIRRLRTALTHIDGISPQSIVEFFTKSDFLKNIMRACGNSQGNKTNALADLLGLSFTEKLYGEQSDKTKLVVDTRIFNEFNQFYNKLKSADMFATPEKSNAKGYEEWLKKQIIPALKTVWQLTASPATEKLKQKTTSASFAVDEIKPAHEKTKSDINFFSALQSLNRSDAANIPAIKMGLIRIGTYLHIFDEASDAFKSRPFYNFIERCYNIRIIETHWCKNSPAQRQKKIKKNLRDGLTLEAYNDEYVLQTLAMSFSFTVQTVKDGEIDFSFPKSEIAAVQNTDAEQPTTNQPPLTSASISAMPAGTTATEDSDEEEPKDEEMMHFPDDRSDTGSIRSSSSCQSISTSNTSSSGSSYQGYSNPLNAAKFTSPIHHRPTSAAATAKPTPTKTVLPVTTPPSPKFPQI